MACCRPKKARLMLAGLCAAFCLTGCAGKPLAEREIVRAVFFAREGGQYQAVLLLQDQQSEEAAAYRTSAGAGDTAAQALSNAAGGLDGTVFYGAMDAVGLPPGSGWAELRQFAELVGDTARPAPDVSLFLLDQRSAARLEETAGELYDDLRQCEKRYAVHCGLEMPAAQPDAAALPCWQGGGYGFAILCRDAEPLRYTEALRAQLAAILCGQAGRLDLQLDGDAVSCQAAVTVRCRPSPDCLRVQLVLADARLAPLAPDAPQQEDALRALLRQELETAFARLCTDAGAAGADPFRFSFWAQNLLGPDAAPLPAVLQVIFA